MKNKTWTYPRYAKVIKDEKVVLTCLTQLYQIGVYVCIESPNGIHREQLNLTPAQTVKIMKSFDQSNLKDGYTSEIGTVIHVTENEQGFYKELSIDEFYNQTKTKRNDRFNRR